MRENGGLGVDHGRASIMFVMGGGIRGGLSGNWPGLTPVNIDGNVPRFTVPEFASARSISDRVLVIRDRLRPTCA